MKKWPLIALSMLFAGTGVYAAEEATPAQSLPVKITTPGDGLLSAGVYDSHGTLIRHLAAAQAVKAGATSLAWDATNDFGLPVSPGDYTVRGVFFTQPPKANYVMKVGISGEPPYPLADGTGGWGGNLYPPTDICSNGKDMIAVFGCVEDNLNTGVQRMDATGKVIGRYHTFFPWDGRWAGAMDASHFYMAVTTNAGIDPIRCVIAKYDINNPKGTILADLPMQKHPAPDGRWKGRFLRDVRGLAVAGDRIYATIPLDNKLFVVDTNSGKILNTIDLPAPRGVASHGSDVYAISSNRLLKLNPDGSTAATVIASGLEDPSNVAIDSAGRFYISDRGDAQQVKVFSPNGQQVATIGKTGGRPRNGLFDPAGMLDPRGLCIGTDGNLWVTEANEDFQRVSVWSLTDGKLVREFFNTRISSGQGKLSPDHSQMLFIQPNYSDAPGLTSYKVDFEKGTWYPAWHYDQPMAAMKSDVLIGNKQIFGQLAQSFEGHGPYLSFAGPMVKATNGHTYLIGGDASIYQFDDPSKPPRLAALVYTHRVADRQGDGPYEGQYDQGPNGWLASADLNGDGKISYDEITFAPNIKLFEKVQRMQGWQLQPDLSLLMLAGDRVANGEPNRWVVYRLSPKEIKPDGTPVYDWADVKIEHELQIPPGIGGDGWKASINTQLNEFSVEGSTVYTCMEARKAKNVTLTLGGIDGDGWWAGRNWRVVPEQLDLQTGAPSWLMLGRRAPGKARPGEMYSPRCISGHVDGCVFVPDTLSQTWVWTDTGLYLGDLYDEFGTEGRDANGVHIESVGSFAYKINGKVYNCIGDHGVFVHQIDLPKLTPIDAGRIKVTPAIAQAAKPWDPDGPAPGKRPTYVATCLYNFAGEREWAQKHKGDKGDKSQFQLRTINIDGKLDDAEWSNIAAAPIRMDDKQVATLKVAFDKETLYLAYDVTDNVGFKNAGTELPYAPFTSGAYVDFCVGRDWTSPNRAGNAEGDTRVILANITAGKQPSYQMGFFPIKSKYAKNPQTITSPAAQRKFDDIAPLPDLKWAWRPTEHGYTVEVAVRMQPAQDLGLFPTRDSQVGFDASVAFANTAGNIRQRAAHWGGESEAAVVDRPGSAALLPATWGTLVFDRNQLVPTGGEKK